jgi:hypothetical protein
MENALHLAFQPHSRLTLVYTRDGFDAGSSTKEAFGMLSGFPLDGYLKAGRLRTPFGLRTDDHTVATRNGFLDFFAPLAQFSGAGDYVVPGFLPYDPRQPDMGVEAGAGYGPILARLAVTNGNTHPLRFGPDVRNQAITAKLIYTASGYQGGISLYDDFHPEYDFSVFPAQLLGVRATRWGAYGLAHGWNLAFHYEVAAGTDAYGAAKLNSLAWYGELDWRVTQGINLRARADRMELARGAGTALDLGRLNTHTRYALEGEFDPVPFAQIRWTLRYVDHAAERLPGLGVGVEDERQAYLQFHFSY